MSQPLNGDFNFLQDDDEDRTAYIVYNSDKNGDQCGACHIPPCDCGEKISGFDALFYSCSFPEDDPPPTPFRLK